MEALFGCTVRDLMTNENGAPEGDAVLCDHCRRQVAEVHDAV